jgi:hypothetical protein
MAPVRHIYGTQPAQQISCPSQQRMMDWEMQGRMANKHMHEKHKHHDRQQ